MNDSCSYFPERLKRKTFTLIFFASLLFTVHNQETFSQDNTLFLMPGIPQSNQLNPALMIPCRTYVELPLISSVRVFIRNSAFGFHDAIHSGTGAKSNIYYPDLTSVDNKMKRINYFQTELDVNLFGFGFGIKDWYFTFGMSSHSDQLFSYPHDVISLKDGNWQVDKGLASPVDLSRLGMEITFWNSIGVSAAKKVNDGLRIGMRLKYLQGMANLITPKSELSINTTTNPVTLEARLNYQVNASFPVKVGYAANGLVNSLNFANTFNDFAGDFIFNGNRGMALDAGVVYDLDDITQLSASFTDLGFIHWRKNINNFGAKGNFIFNGIDLDQYQTNSSSTDLLKALGDSITKAFSPSGSSQAYTTLLPVKIFGGVTRLLMPNLRAGAMGRVEIYNLHFMPSMTLSMNYTPIPYLAASLSYTIMNNKFDQVGAGIALGNTGGQFYIVTDNIPLRFTKDSRSALMWPYNARMLSLRFGFNLIFGCNNKKNELKSAKYHRRDICPAYW